uniref:Histone-lysine N-methyltransferase 2C n=1 Tax=Macrostomum lignano TaxID=282301 RepID=A0A1I8G389_9PLAT
MQQHQQSDDSCLDETDDSPAANRRSTAASGRSGGAGGSENIASVNAGSTRRRSSRRSALLRCGGSSVDGAAGPAAGSSASAAASSLRPQRRLPQQLVPQPLPASPSLSAASAASPEEPSEQEDVEDEEAASEAFSATASVNEAEAAEDDEDGDNEEDADEDLDEDYEAEEEEDEEEQSAGAVTSSSRSRRRLPETRSLSEALPASTVSADGSATGGGARSLRLRSRLRQLHRAGTKRRTGSAESDDDLSSADRPGVPNPWLDADGRPYGLVHELARIGHAELPDLSSLADADGGAWAHHCCAAWSPEVVMNAAGELENVDKALGNSLWQRCAFCKRLGASIPCCAARCSRRYHFVCAAAAGCFQDYSTLRLWCWDHLALADTSDEHAMCYVCDKALPDLADLLYCTACGQHYHASCLEPRVTLSPTVRVGWQCPDCKACIHCGENKNEEKLLICDVCDKAFHTYCLRPAMRCIPKSGWKCTRCRVCWDCGARSLGIGSAPSSLSSSPTSSRVAVRWHANYTQCDRCHHAARTRQQQHQRRPSASASGVRTSGTTNSTASSKHRKLASSAADTGDSVLDKDDHPITVVVCRQPDESFFCSQDVCVACGSIGDSQSQSLLCCSQCGQCYHTFCAGVSKLAQHNFSRCGLCHSHYACPLCTAQYREGDLLVHCAQCERWCHALCDGLANEAEAELATDLNYLCYYCRGQVPLRLPGGCQADLPAYCSSDSGKQFFMDGVVLSEIGMLLVRGAMLKLPAKMSAQQLHQQHMLQQPHHQPPQQQQTSPAVEHSSPMQPQDSNKLRKPTNLGAAAAVASAAAPGCVSGSASGAAGVAAPAAGSSLAAAALTPAAASNAALSPETAQSAAVASVSGAKTADDPEAEDSDETRSVDDLMSMPAMAPAGPAPAANSAAATAPAAAPASSSSTPAAAAAKVDDAEADRDDLGDIIPDVVGVAGVGVVDDDDEDLLFTMLREDMRSVGIRKSDLQPSQPPPPPPPQPPPPQPPSSAASTSGAAAEDDLDIDNLDPSLTQLCCDHTTVQDVIKGLGGPLPPPPPPSAPLSLQPASSGEDTAAAKRRINTQRWLEDESLGDRATAASIFYANQRAPNLRQEMPNSEERCRHVNKMWRKLPAEERHQWVVMARANKSQQQQQQPQQQQSKKASGPSLMDSSSASGAQHPRTPTSLSSSSSPLMSSTVSPTAALYQQSKQAGLETAAQIWKLMIHKGLRVNQAVKTVAQMMNLMMRQSLVVSQAVETVAQMMNLMMRQSLLVSQAVETAAQMMKLMMRQSLVVNQAVETAAQMMKLMMRQSLAVNQAVETAGQMIKLMMRQSLAVNQAVETAGQMIKLMMRQSLV